MPSDTEKQEQPHLSAKSPSTNPASALIKKALIAMKNAGKPKPTPRARLTPVPLQKRDWPVYIALPLKNGGILRGDLTGKENGKLVVKVGSQKIRFDPARLKHSPEQLLAEAQSAYAGNHKHTARQYAATAMLLLDDPTEAKALLEKCR